MNRYVKGVLVACVVLMFLIGGGAVLLRWLAPDLVAQGPLPHRPLGPLFLLGFPAAMAAILVATLRQMAAYIPGISEDNRRHVQGALVFLHLCVVVCMAWIAFLYLGARPPFGEIVVRLIAVLFGVSMAVRGNFVAKLSPPPLKTPPDPAVWGRMARRTGRVLVALGSVLAVCAVILPLRGLLPALFVALVVLIGLSLAQRRAMAAARGG